MSPLETKSIIGERIVRREDLRFITGAGEFTDDLNPPPHAAWDRGAIDAFSCTDRATRRAPRCHHAGRKVRLDGGDVGRSGLHVVPVDLPPPGRIFENWDAPAQPILTRDAAITGAKSSPALNLRGFPTAIQRDPS